MASGFGRDGNDGGTKRGRLVTNDAISVGTIGITQVTNYGVSTKIAHTGFLNRIIRMNHHWIVFAQN